MISEAIFATSVPAIPIENPTFASFKAGPSFVPSPVTATISPMDFKVLTRICLSRGDDRARTRRVGRILSRFSWLSSRNSEPSIDNSAVAKGFNILAFNAILFAVFKLSPVTIRTVIPAF
eukprot:NODE_40_length_35084_cov_0.543519.p25 type:complete len:120 gc:universal NODE_40_length_35084_cov_0.543519:29904-30263(+)